MYSGLLPIGLSEADLSDDSDQSEDVKSINGNGESEINFRDARQSVVNTQTSSAMSETKSTSDACCDSFTDACPAGVSSENWQKFKNLQRAKEEQRLNQPKEKKTRRRRRKKGVIQHSDGQQKREIEEKQVEQWKEIRQYFGVNDRLKPPPSNRPPPMSSLEKSIESAIAEGDYRKAEELSDTLATRELAVKIANAADCRDFARNKQQEDAFRAAQKRTKQIAWGFEAKKRWETKSNMGYM